MPPPPPLRLKLNSLCAAGGTWRPKQVRRTSSSARVHTKTATALDEESHVAPLCVVKPRAIFPWRSEITPLPRLVEPPKPDLANNEYSEEERKKLLTAYYESEYFTKGGLLGQGWPSPAEAWFRGALFANSLRLLGISWPTILMPWTRNECIHELEHAFCCAFSCGVTSILPIASCSHVRKDSPDDAEFDVNVDIILDSTAEKSETNIDCGGNGDEYNMLQQDLRKLYQSARKHSHPTKLNMVLRTVPKSAEVQSMFPVFGLSRKLVRDHPNLKHSYRNLGKDLQRMQNEAAATGRGRLNPVDIGRFLFDGLEELMERSAKLSGDDRASITLVAQVLIRCREVFCVKDCDTGEITQGWNDVMPRDVQHLVRFEMVIRESMDEGLEIGRWQIVDWDDLLEGNIFFT